MHPTEKTIDRAKQRRLHRDLESLQARRTAVADLLRSERDRRQTASTEAKAQLRHAVIMKTLADGIDVVEVTGWTPARLKEHGLHPQSFATLRETTEAVAAFEAELRELDAELLPLRALCKSLDAYAPPLGRLTLQFAGDLPA